MTGGTKQRQQLIRAGTMHWIHWFIVVVSIVLTLVAWYFSKEQLRDKIKNQFNRESERVVKLVQERMELYENALWGGVALYDASEEVTYYEWMDYARSIRIDTRYPGINGIGVIYNVKPGEMKAYMTREKKWRPNYHLHPQHNESEYWPITYVEPAEPNKKAIGLDMCFETNRYTGIKKSRDTGMAQLTGPIVLVQDDKKTPGFLFYTPFYKDGKKPKTLEARREHIVGVTYAPFIMYKLMQGALSKENRHVNIRISDGGQLLYDDNTSDTGEKIELIETVDSQPLFKKQTAISMYGRQWVFDISSNLSFRKASSSSQPYIILFGGIAVDTMLFCLFLFLSKANRRALSYADTVTEELRDKTEHLEVEKEKAEYANVAKSHFLANMSHELRTPLNSILLLSEMLNKNKQNNLTEKQILSAEIIHKSGSSLLDLIDEILDLSKVEAGKMDRELGLIVTSKLIDNLKGQFAMLSQKKGLSFTIEKKENFPDTFLNDIKRIDQVLKNLLSNAFKFTHKGGVTLTFFRPSREVQFRMDGLNHDNCLAFSVADTGIGISHESQKAVFEEFIQIDSGLNRQYEGTGLGLAIVKKISFFLGGEVQLVSEKGKGSTFTFYIPELTTKGACDERG